MQNKNMERAAQLLYKACREQHLSEKACHSCDFYDPNGHSKCLAGYPAVWDAFFPELATNND